MSLVHGIRAALLSCALTAILTACGSKDACSGGETQECFGSMPCTCYCAGTQACGTGMPDCKSNQICNQKVDGFCVDIESYCTALLASDPANTLNVCAPYLSSAGATCN